MNRRLHGALAGALGLAVGGLGVIAAGAGSASAATAARGATVTLTPRSDSITDSSPFTQVSVSKACPAGYQDNLSVFLVTADGSESGIAFNLTDGAPFSTAPVTAQEPADSTGSTYVNSIADAFSNVNAPLVNGTYPIHVVCGSADPAHFPDRPTSTGFIDVTGDTWQVDSRQAPIATKVKLAAAPVRHVQVGQTFTLTATVTPAVTGTVRFSADGGANPIGTPVAVVNGVASVTVPTNALPAVRHYDAVFVPSDQLTYAQAYGLLDYAFVAAPGITVKDAAGNTLGSNPQLTAGQQITVSATGFQPSTGESVDASITKALFGALPVGLPATTSNASGAVTNYTVTLPACISAGSHQLVLSGETSKVKITFGFTTK
ncbi:Ig-like domain repeat protein [Streptomyces sp. NRRL F-5123]|uniref:Ig-like domain repeat protein n=1 Tax=Streptomyces sp. NRRL F-5123 TaxID=1463856 RepID=UPI0004E15EA2|nr:Ig-like domain repeat protein [Streptomyces sp. NRRL F-5123]